MITDTHAYVACTTCAGTVVGGVQLSDVMLAYARQSAESIQVVTGHFIPAITDIYRAYISRSRPLIIINVTINLMSNNWVPNSRRRAAAVLSHPDAANLLPFSRALPLLSSAVAFLRLLRVRPLVNVVITFRWCLLRLPC